MILKRTIDKEQISSLPRETFKGKITLVQTEEEAGKALEYLETCPLVGIDSETRPSFVKGQSHKVALLQVATGEICFLFRLNLIGFPPPLIRLLENPDIKKVGLSLNDDFTMLHRRAKFDQQACIDIQNYIAPFGIKDRSLQKIYAILFKRRISKSQRLSNWEADVLSNAQQLYAATDAWACYRIYMLLQNLQHTGNYQLEEVPTPNEQQP